MEKVRKAVIPAAGLGTRFLPATKAQPKEMLPIVDKPMIQYVVEEAVRAGIEEIIIVTGRNKRAIEDHFDKALELEYHLKERGKHDLLKELAIIPDDVHLSFVRQSEPLGLGHAVLCAKKHVGGEPFAIMLGDDVFVSEKPAIGQMIDEYEAKGKSMMSLQRVPLSEVSRYGVINGREVGKGLYRIDAIVEKPSPSEAPSDLATYGRYVFDGDLMDCLEHTGKGKGGEIQLVDGINLFLKKKEVYGKFLDAKRYDAGDKYGLLVANIELALRRKEFAPRLKEYLRDLTKKEFDVS